MDRSDPKYVIDTCSLTELRRRYPDDVFPGAWEAITVMADSGILISSTEVGLELEAQDDLVTDWARKHSFIFVPLFPSIQLKAQEILSDFTNLIDDKNLKSSADPFLIATAIIKGCTVVTEETPSGKDAKIVKIPNVCATIGISCINLIELLRIERVKLEIKRN
jgi:hypothetical protein